MKKPYISKEVCDYIQNLFSLIEINPCDNLPDIYFRAGQNSVAKHIRQLYEKQNSQDDL